MPAVIDINRFIGFDIELEIKNRNLTFMKFDKNKKYGVMKLLVRKETGTLKNRRFDVHSRQ